MYGNVMCVCVCVCVFPASGPQPVAAWYGPETLRFPAFVHLLSLVIYMFFVT